MNQKNMFSFFRSTHALVLISFFIALYAVFSLFAIYITGNLRFNLTFMPLIWASALFGPFAGGITGVFGDILGWIIRPVGPFFPGFTISGFVSGLIYGFILFKKEMTVFRVLIAAITMIVIVEIGLNTLWLRILNGEAFKVLILGRFIKALVILPIQMFVLYSTEYFFKRIPGLSYHRNIG